MTHNDDLSRRNGRIQRLRAIRRGVLGTAVASSLGIATLLLTGTAHATSTPASAGAHHDVTGATTTRATGRTTGHHTTGHRTARHYKAHRVAKAQAPSTPVQSTSTATHSSSSGS